MPPSAAPAYAGGPHLLRLLGALAARGGGGGARVVWRQQAVPDRHPAGRRAEGRDHMLGETRKAAQDFLIAARSGPANAKFHCCFLLLLS